MILLAANGLLELLGVNNGNGQGATYTDGSATSGFVGAGSTYSYLAFVFVITLLIHKKKFIAVQ